MIASLPMYDWPETRTATDRFWMNLATTLAPVCEAIPKTLTRTDLHAQWQRDDMLLSQTCIYPLVTELPSDTVVVGTPTYNVDATQHGRYASILLVGKSNSHKKLPSFKGSTLAYNSTRSQSGFNALKSLLVDEHLIDKQTPVFFPKTIQTGAHRLSIEAVASGAADICAVDPVSWALAQRYDSNSKKLHILKTTAYTPALPLISNASAIPAALNETEWRGFVMDAFEKAIDSDARKQLFLNSICFIPKDDYFKLPISNVDMIT